MRVLCNLPLECFDDRAAMRDVELLTYGPRDRMMVDGVHFPFDVAFDPSRGGGCWLRNLWHRHSRCGDPGSVCGFWQCRWLPANPEPADGQQQANQNGGGKKASDGSHGDDRVG